MTPQERKAQAIELRKAGCTYKDIAQETGYSLDWCKQNLKSVEKNSAEKDAIRSAINKARSPDGITHSEIVALIMDVYPYQDTAEYKTMQEKAIKRFKTAINKEDGTAIRPYWMQPEAAQESFNLVLASVDSVQQSMDDAVDYVRRQLDLDQSHDKSIRFTIIKMLYCGSLTLQGVEAYCAGLASVVDTLRNKRNNVLDNYTLSHHNIYTPQKSTLSGLYSEKCISVELHHDLDGSELIDIDDFPMWEE